MSERLTKATGLATGDKRATTVDALVSGRRIAGAYGSLQMFDDGSYAYSANAIDQASKGEIKDTFTVVEDGVKKLVEFVVFVPEKRDGLDAASR